MENNKETLGDLAARGAKRFAFTNQIGMALLFSMLLFLTNVVTRLQYVLTEGKPSGTASPWFTRSMTCRIGGVIPTSVFYGFFIFLPVFFILNRSRYGMRLFLTGNNERAACLAVFNMSQAAADMVMAIVLIAILAMYNRRAPVRQ
ncbi:MAG: hypothetical protein LBD47_10405 [Treponema sp.]|jgi:ribose/xylose/arabinose/galactoside ABC-type transport system permease subunit|nr:hypothetical protein [Treponema sp.]